MTKGKLALLRDVMALYIAPCKTSDDGRQGAAGRSGARQGKAGHSGARRGTAGHGEAQQ